MHTERRPTTTTLTEKLALATGTAVIGCCAGGGAQAGIVQAPGTPIRAPAQGGFSDWDIDGNGHDFSVWNFSTLRTGTDGSGNPYSDLLRIGGLSGYSASGYKHQLLGLGDGLKKLNTGASVGANPIGAGWLSYAVTMTTEGVMNGSQAFQGWSMGQSGLFGFRFYSTDLASYLYGWGEITFDPTSANTNGYGFRITRAYYEDTGNPIAAGDDGSGGGGAVPEPSTLALALLAAGSVVAYRARKTALAS